MRRIHRFAVALAAGAAFLPAEALAYDPGKASRYPSPDLFRPNADGIVLRGDASSGDASGLCSKLPQLGVCRSLADRAADAPSVLDLPGVVCDGVHDDRPGIQAALNLAEARQGEVRLPLGKTCAVGDKLTMRRAKLRGGGPGSALKALKAMPYMVDVTLTLAAIREMTFLGAGLAESAVRVDTEADALQTWVEGNYFTGFTGAAIRHDGGQHLIVRGNASISNGMFFAGNNQGVNDVIEDNYSAGGNGILSQAAPNGSEGMIIRGNTIFARGNPAWYALKITAAIDTKIEGNTLESSCQTLILDGISTGVTAVSMSHNWIGTEKGGQGDNPACAALVAQNLVRGFTSNQDKFAGRGYRAILTTANSPALANSNFVITAPWFDDLTATERSSIDMHLSYLQGFSITAAMFSGGQSIVEGAGLAAGRVDGSIFTAPPVRGGGIKYGRQVFGINNYAEGTGQISAGTNAVDVPFTLSYTPSQQDIMVNLIQRPTNDVGSCAVVGVTATKFTYQCFNAPGGSGVNFIWKIDNSR